MYSLRDGELHYLGLIDAQRILKILNFFAQ